VGIGAVGAASATYGAIALPPDSKTPRDDDAAPAAVKPPPSDRSSPLDDARAILSSPRLRLLFAASLARFSAGLTIGVWSASYFRGAYPDDAANYAIVNAAIVSLCGITSGILGGRAGDALAVGGGVGGALDDLDPDGKRLVVSVVGSLLAVPAWWMVVHASGFIPSMVWLAVEYLVAECWFGPTVAVLQSTAGKGRGGTAQGMFTLTGALGNLSPSVLGVLYASAVTTAVGDTGAVESAAALGDLMGVVVCGAYLVSAGLFAASALAPAESQEVEKR